MNDYIVVRRNTLKVLAYALGAAVFAVTFAAMLVLGNVILKIT